MHPSPAWKDTAEDIGCVLLYSRIMRGRFGYCGSSRTEFWKRLQTG